MDILFFNPPQTKNGNSLNNYTLLWIASYLKKRNVSCKIVYLSKNFNEVVYKTLSKYNPKFVAISCKWYTNLFGAIKIADIVKKINNKIKIITGGYTASYYTQDLLKNSEFDIVIHGDAEFPLENLILSNKLINCTVKTPDGIKDYSHNYISSPKEMDDYTLMNLNEILDSCDILNSRNFIWVGKGCTANCFYCGGTNKCQIEIFRRKKMTFRSVENVIKDMYTVSKYSDTIQLDFQDPKKKDDEIYYKKIFKEIDYKKFNCEFHCWYLPSIEFISFLSEVFKKAELVLDTITLSEALRYQLFDRKLIKSDFSNKDIETVINHSNKKDNIFIKLYSIAGLPDESEMNRLEHIKIAKEFLKKYYSIIEVYHIPLSVEPASMLQQYSNILGMKNYRKDFYSFFNIGKASFENNIIYPFNKFFHKFNRYEKSVHPYGVHALGASERKVYNETKQFYDSVKLDIKLNQMLSYKQMPK